jgi:hypothetical protein
VSQHDPEEQQHLSRRDFTTSTAMLALTPQLHGRQSEIRTLFFNLSHENYEGHTYYIVIGKQRHLLTPVRGTHPAFARARRTNSVLAKLPDSAVTHVAENIQLPPAVHLTYTIKDPDTSTGTWGMSSIYLLVPKSSFAEAYKSMRKGLRFTEGLPLSAKRKKYGLVPAISLQDLVDEQDLLDSNDWATAMVNLHPEMLSADPNSAALIQTKYINVLSAIGQLSEALSIAGTAMPQESAAADNTQGWATLVPYTDSDDVTPLKNTTGNNKGLILYDEAGIALGKRRPYPRRRCDTWPGKPEHERSDRDFVVQKRWCRQCGSESGSVVADRPGWRYLHAHKRNAELRRLQSFS